MSSLLSVLGSLFILGLVIFVHELGHLLAAKLSKVSVSRFSVGFGRPIWSREFCGTLYQLAIVPCGGFVEVVGQSDSGAAFDAQLKRVEGKLSAQSLERLRDRSRWFQSRPGWAQMLVAAGGPLFSFLFTIVVFTVLGWSMGSAEPSGQPTIAMVMPNSPAARAGLLAGDKIVSIDGSPTTDTALVVERISLSGGTPVSIEVLRSANSLRLSATPEADSVQIPGKGPAYRIGIQLMPQVFEHRDVSLSEAFQGSVGMVGESIGRSAKLLKLLVTGGLPLSSLQGPVGMTQAGTSWVRDGLISALVFAGLISSAIGACQLIPFPPLDGSRMLFAGWKMLTGKPVNRMLEGVMTAIGFYLLLGLMLVISARELFWLTL